MKKFVFVLISAILALSLVACDVFTPPTEAEGLDFDDLKPGEFYVDVGTGGNRALTSALARAGADFFEVVLVDGSVTPNVVYRTTFREGRNGRMEAPKLGNYNNNTTDNLYAYIFAGRYDDRTLLGVGVLTHTDEGLGAGLVANANAAISANTRAVQFTVQALTTDVTSDYIYTDSGSAPVPTDYTSDSTFRPWDALTGILPNSRISDFAAKIKVDNAPASIFLLPAQTTAITDVPYEILTSHAAAIIAAPTTLTTDVPKVEIRGYIWSDGDYAPVEITSASITAMSTFDDGAVTPVDLGKELLLTITTGTLSGLGRLSIEYPVVMFTAADSDNGDATDNKPEVWYLRGGLNNAIVDMGKDFNAGRGSMGGAILIGVGQVLAGAGGFVVGKTP